MKNRGVWYMIPKLIQIDRGEGDEPAVEISQGFANNTMLNSLGVDGGLTLREVEDLAWRVKQATHLLKHGRLPPNHR